MALQLVMEPADYRHLQQMMRVWVAAGRSEADPLEGNSYGEEQVLLVEEQAAEE